MSMLKGTDRVVPTGLGASEMRRLKDSFKASWPTYVVIQNIDG